MPPRWTSSHGFRALSSSYLPGRHFTGRYLPSPAFRYHKQRYGNFLADLLSLCFFVFCGVCLQNLSYISRLVRGSLRFLAGKTEALFYSSTFLVFAFTMSVRKGSRHGDSCELEWEGRFEKASRTAQFCSSEHSSWRG